MKIKITKNLVIQIKTISWLGTIGILLIWAGLIFGLIFQPILLSGKLDLGSIIMCLFFSLFCIFGLTISLSTKEWHFNRLEGEFMSLDTILFFKSVTRYRIQEIQRIEFKKYIDHDDDTGGVWWNVDCYLLSGKIVHICRFDHKEEKGAQKLTQTIKKYLMLP